MTVEGAQSCTLFASLQYTATRSATQTSSELAVTLMASREEGVDVFELTARVDTEFANRVLHDSLRERLDAALKEAGVSASAEELLASGLDTSPEATSKRIVEFSVSFLAAYTESHPDGQAGPRLEGFMTLIREAIEKGFSEARDLLSGIGEVPEDVAAGIDRTHSLVMQGLDTFASEQRQALGLEV